MTGLLRAIERLAGHKSAAAAAGAGHNRDAEFGVRGSVGTGG
jgi:hypothetical protein